MLILLVTAAMEEAESSPEIVPSSSTSPSAKDVKTVLKKKDKGVVKQEAGAVKREFSVNEDEDGTSDDG